MSARRFHCPDLAAGLLTLASEESHHAAHVMRVKAGEEVQLFDGSGRTAAAVVETVQRRAVSVRCQSPVSAPSPPGVRLTLLTAAPRAPRQPFLVEKCTELAVARIVPVRFERSTVTMRPAGILRWRRASIEAAKQCGCNHLPLIDPPQTLDDGLRIACFADAHTLALPASDRTLPEVLAARRLASLAVWIGPEGGMTADEEWRILESGAEAISLGTQVLRIETAALAVAAWCRLACPRPV